MKTSKKYPRFQNFTTKQRDCTNTSNNCFYSRARRKCSSITITTTKNVSKFINTFIDRHSITDVACTLADLQNDIIPPACRTAKSITKSDSTSLMNHCYMDKATNRLIAHFTTSSIINISKRNITRSEKELSLIQTREEIEK